MVYTFIGEYPCDVQNFIPPVSFNKNILILKANFPNVRKSWYKAADVYQFINVPDIGNIYSTKKLYLPLNKPTELLFLPSSEEYNIQIDFPYWITANNVNLQIWESTMPSFQGEVRAVSSIQFANKLSTSVAVSTTVSNVAANSLRKGLKIRNRGTNTVYVGYNDPALTVATAAFSILPGDVYEEDDVFTGILHFVTQTGTSNLVVTEMIS